MAPMPFTELGLAGQQSLLELAWRSIRKGLESGQVLSVDEGDVSPELWQRASSFVTLRKQGDLRGCIGALQATQPLARDVVAHAFAAAFRDPRFSPVRPDELEQITLSISVLAPPRPLVCKDEADLLKQLRVGVDGLILEESAVGARATFLPSVWEQLPQPADFLRALKQKAGLNPAYWSDTLRWQRYETFSFGP